MGEKRQEWEAPEVRAVPHRARSACGVEEAAGGLHAFRGMSYRRNVLSKRPNANLVCFEDYEVAGQTLCFRPEEEAQA